MAGSAVGIKQSSMVREQDGVHASSVQLRSRSEQLSAQDTPVRARRSSEESLRTQCQTNHESEVSPACARNSENFKSDISARSIFPDEKLVEKGNVYLLYRGILCYAEIFRMDKGGFVPDHSITRPEKSSSSTCCVSATKYKLEKSLPLRMWVDVYRMDLCVASQDSPASQTNRFPINFIAYPMPNFDICEDYHEICLDIWKNHASPGDVDADIPSDQRSMRRTRIRMLAHDDTKVAPDLQGFSEAPIDKTCTRKMNSRVIESSLQNKSQVTLSVELFFDMLRRLRHCFETDWPAVSHIMRNVYQYLWRNRALAMTDIEMMEGQATLAFNLNPKMGIQYLKSKVLENNADNENIARWLVRMSAAHKGGIDPSILGTYFARKDTTGIYVHFLSNLNFCQETNEKTINEDVSTVPGVAMGLVPALRYLFATFKPVGEMQIVDRLLKHFADEYFRLLQDEKKSEQEQIQGLHVKKSETLYVLSFAAIVCNHELNMGPKLAKKGIDFIPRTVDQFVKSVRESQISHEEVEDQYIRQIYNEVKKKEIQMHPLPRVPFNNLPVQPDIEGWLVVILKGRPSQRFWAVVAMQRLYLFSDSDEINAFLCIDLKNVSARSVDREFLKRVIQNRSRPCSPFSTKDVPVDRAFILQSAQDTPLVHDVPPPVSLQSKPVLQRVVKRFFGALVPQKLYWIVCVAESKDMSDKWMNSWDQSRPVY